MIPPADITSVKSLVLAEAAPAPTGSTAVSVSANLAQGAPGNITQAAIGQLFQTQVLTKLEDGTFLVNVANNVLRMALPADTNVGETLPMTLLASEPRPTFLVTQQNDGSSASLSDAAKVINTALQAAQQSGAPQALVGKTPLLAAPTTNPPKIAAVLQDSIELSGLFYESHVSQWVDGQRPLSDLLQEPQTNAPATPQVEQSSQTSRAGAATNTATTAKAQSVGAQTVLPRPAISDADLSRLMDNLRNTSDGQTKLTQALNTLLNARNLPQQADAVVRSPNLTQQSAQTINLQLNALEQHRVAWQGELWPGQHFEWEISDESNHGGHAGNADGGQTSWQSVIRFDLPKLGKISATINLAGGHVHVRVATASQSSAATLKAHGDLLASALDAAGSPLDSLTIKQDEAAQS
ncbi:MAG: flagellar hook-length control protein FliK [Burkholderiaceae bacterium]|nr:flagellar hook-length control protein FliK [Burkholderiaceae bacterium]